MVNIELTSSQAEELKEFYTLELEKIQKRETVVRELLTRLDNEMGIIIKPVIKPANEPVSPKETTSDNPKWSNFIIEILKEKQKPLSRKTIAKLYQQQNNTNVTTSKNVMKSLTYSLSWLSNKKNVIQSIKTPGKKEKLYEMKESPEKSIFQPKPEKKEQKKILQKKPDKESRDKPGYNWPAFIINTLNKTKRVMSAKEFIGYAITAFDIPKNDVQIAKKNISPTLSVLNLKSKTLNTVLKKGQRGKSYGLSNWFYDNGELIPDYK